MTSKVMLSVRDLEITYGRGAKAHRAVRDVNFDVHEGQTLGIVGESGSGKSTVARAITGLIAPSNGSIMIDGLSQGARSHLSLVQRGRQVQMIFQDPYSSLDPMMTVGDSIMEGLRLRGRRTPSERKSELERVLGLVRLPASIAGRRPAQLSGGMRQRVCIARVLAARPRLIVADEITSALDASVQGSVLNLLRDIRERTGMTMVFISHNLAAVRYISDEIVVMEAGQVVESGATEDVILSPQHPYTRSLISAVPAFGRRNTIPSLDCAHLSEVVTAP